MTFVAISCGDDDSAPNVSKDLISRISGDDFTTTFRYNGFDQLIEKVTEGNLRVVETYVYNGGGQIVGVTMTTERDGDVLLEIACGLVWDGDFLMSQLCVASPSNIRTTDNCEWTTDRSGLIESRDGANLSTGYTFTNGNVRQSTTQDESGTFPNQRTVSYDYSGGPTFEVDVFGPNNFNSAQINAHPSGIRSIETRQINSDLTVITTEEIGYEFVTDENDRVVEIIETNEIEEQQNDLVVIDEVRTSTTTIEYRS